MWKSGACGLGLPGIGRMWVGMPALRAKATIAVPPSQQNSLTEVTIPPSAAVIDTRFSFGRPHRCSHHDGLGPRERGSVRRNPALGRFATSLACLARQAGPLAFKRLQNEGFI